jgi:hypothetical protein
MLVKIFTVLVVVLVAVFSVCAIALLLSGVATLVGSTGSGGITAMAGGVSINFLKLIAVAVIVLAVGILGLTRIGRFLR